MSYIEDIGLVTSDSGYRFSFSGVQVFPYSSEQDFLIDCAIFIWGLGEDTIY